MKQSNFLGVPMAPLNKARFVVLPLPYEQTTSYGKGTARGPQAIISASAQLEHYDEELDQETYSSNPDGFSEQEPGTGRRNGIHTTYPKGINFRSAPERFIPALAKYADKLVNKLSSQQILVGLGGEHSITYPLVKAYHKLYPNLSVLQLDAHSDLRDEYEGSRYSHACVMRRVLELQPSSIVQIGIRSMTPECAQLVRRKPFNAFMAHSDCRLPGLPLLAGLPAGLPERVLKALKSNDVYITIDLDAFDPSIMPGLGTPEPGGLGWYPVLDILRLVCRKKNVVGFDVMELMPVKGQIISDYTAAKLVYRMMGYLT
jgi:agmatinase